MDNLYLTRLRLNEFRTFSQCDVTLPDMPSVLLVSGPNGLGKSTLFDGLEWCLAGEVDRFGAAAKGVDGRDYLRRWDAPDGVITSAEATFGGDSILRRKLSTADAAGDIAGADPADLLRSESWNAKIGLHHYLLLTHFLGQSTVTRMTHRDARDRWEYLKGPAQSDWAQDIGSALHGHGNSGEAKAYTAAISAAQEIAARIEQLLQAEQIQFDAIRAVGGLSTDQVAAGTRDAIVRLGSAGVLPNDGQPDDAVPPAEQLESLAGAISAASSWLTQREADLERARSLLGLHAEAQRQTVDAQRAMVAEQSRLRELEAQRPQLDADIGAARLTVDEAQAELERAERQVRALERLREMTDTSTRHRQDVSTHEVEERRVAREFQEAEARVVRAQRLLSLTQRTQAARSQVLQSIQAASIRLLSYDELIELDREIEEKVAALDIRVANAPHLSDDLAAARAARGAAAEKYEAARQSLVSARQAVDELTAAVIRVAAHIDDTTCACPVCASEFPTGELQRRATAAADAIGPSLAPLEALAMTAEKDLEEATTRLRELETEHLVLESERQNVAMLRTRRAARLAETDDLAGDVEAGRADEEHRTIRLQSRVQRLERWLSTLGTPSVLQEAWSSELDSRQLLERQLSERRQARTAAEQALRNAEEDLASAAAELGMKAPTEAELSRTLAEARDAAASAEARRSEAARNVERASIALEQNSGVREVCAARERDLSADLQTHEKARNASREAWLKLGFGGDPSADGLDSAARTVEAVRSRLGFAEQNLGRLREGYTVGLQQAAHLQTLSELRKQVSAPSDADREATRRLAAEAQARAARRAKSCTVAQEIAQRASTSIIQQVGAFNRRHLRPVNDLMTKINRAILTEPDVGLELEFQRNAVQQRTRRLSKAPPRVEKLDPLLVHSEGQMAALAVSMLCAASITFPWSRWRALVLDDPLQHNDAVHASAFADLMRALVQEKRYQILLSTHDMGLADFLRRKFAAGDVPCTTVHLVGQGASGTEMEISQSNIPGERTDQNAAG